MVACGTLTLLVPEKIHIQRLTETLTELISPSLTIIYVGNECKVYSNNIFIPPKCKLPVPLIPNARKIFVTFNVQYQNVTK